MARLSMAAPFAAVALISAQAAHHTPDSPDEVKKAIEAGKAGLIDVRESGEWTEGHIKDATNLPLSELKAGVSSEKLKEILPAGKIIYLHCAAGGRCLKAADVLKSSGIDTRPLKPGYADLLKLGFSRAK